MLYGYVALSTTLNVLVSNQLGWTKASSQHKFPIKDEDPASMFAFQQKPKSKWTLAELDLPPAETQKFKKEFTPPVIGMLGIKLHTWFPDDDDSFGEEYAAFVDTLFKRVFAREYVSRLETHREVIDKLACFPLVSTAYYSCSCSFQIESVVGATTSARKH